MAQPVGPLKNLLKIPRRDHWGVGRLNGFVSAANSGSFWRIIHCAKCHLKRNYRNLTESWNVIASSPRIAAENILKIISEANKNDIYKYAAHFQCKLRVAK